MDALVPIIGYGDTSHDPLIKDRIDFQINGMGYEPFYVTPGNITRLNKTSPCNTKVPLIIELTIAEHIRTNDDLVDPIRQQFKTARKWSEQLSNIPKMLFEHEALLSLWAGKIESRLLRTAIIYTYKNLGESTLSVSEISNYCSVCKDTLERKFKVERKVSVWKYVVMMRIYESIRILKESESAIYEIAMAVGFEDLATFDRAFKRVTGMSPREIRQKVKTIH